MLWIGECNVKYASNLLSVIVKENSANKKIWKYHEQRMVEGRSRMTLCDFKPTEPNVGGSL